MELDPNDDLGDPGQLTPAFCVERTASFDDPVPLQEFVYSSRQVPLGREDKREKNSLLYPIPVWPVQRPSYLITPSLKVYESYHIWLCKLPKLRPWSQKNGGDLFQVFCPDSVLLYGMMVDKGRRVDGAKVTAFCKSCRAFEYILQSRVSRNWWCFSLENGLLWTDFDSMEDITVHTRLKLVFPCIFSLAHLQKLIYRDVIIPLLHHLQWSDEHP